MADEKPKIEPIDPASFGGGLEGLMKLKAMLGNVDEIASVVKDRAQKADQTLAQLADFTQKFGATVQGFADLVNMNKKLIDDMLKRANKAMDQIGQ